MDSTGREEGKSILGMDGECTRLVETFSDAVYYDDFLAPVLLERGLLFIHGNFLLNWSKIVANAMKFFRQI